MPRYQEDDRHYVNFLWNSPGNGTLYINKIVWNGYGALLNFLGTILKTFRQVTFALKFMPTRRIGPVSIGVLVSTSI